MVWPPWHRGQGAVPAPLLSGALGRTGQDREGESRQGLRPLRSTWDIWGDGSAGVLSGVGSGRFPQVQPGEGVGSQRGLGQGSGSGQCHRWLPFQGGWLVLLGQAEWWLARLWRWRRPQLGLLGEAELLWAAGHPPSADRAAAGRDFASQTAWSWPWPLHGAGWSRGRCCSVRLQVLLKAGFIGFQARSWGLCKRRWLRCCRAGSWSGMRCTTT